MPRLAPQNFSISNARLQVPTLQRARIPFSQRPPSTISAGRLSSTPIRNSYVQPARMPDTDYLRSFNRFGGALVSEAVNFQERHNKLLANEAILEFQDKARKLYLGDDDQKGYLQLKGVDAVDAHPAYEQQINNTFSNITSNLDPAVKAKALLRMNEVRTTYLNRGATYRVQQQEYADKQATAWAFQQAKQEFELDHQRGWDQAKTAINASNDIRSRLLMEQDFSSYALNKVFDEKKQSGASDLTAWKASNEWFTAHRSELSEGIETDLAFKLRQQRKTIDREAERLSRESKAKLQVITRSTMPTQLVSLLTTKGAAGLIPKLRAQADKTNPGEFLGFTKQALQTLTISKGRAAAQTAWESIRDTYNPVDKAALDYFVFTKADSIEQQLRQFEDNQKNLAVFGEFRQATPQVRMTLEQQVLADPHASPEHVNFVISLRRMFDAEDDVVLRREQDTIYNVIASQVYEAGGFTGPVQQAANQMITEQKMLPSTYEKLVKLGDDLMSGKRMAVRQGVTDLKPLLKDLDIVWNPATSQVTTWDDAQDALESRGYDKAIGHSMALVKISEQYGRWRVDNPQKTAVEFLEQTYGKLISSAQEAAFLSLSGTPARRVRGANIGGTAYDLNRWPHATASDAYKLTQYGWQQICTGLGQDDLRQWLNLGLTAEDVLALKYAATDGETAVTAPVKRHFDGVNKMQLRQIIDSVETSKEYQSWRNQFYRQQAQTR